jgi:hypothetical protein
LVPFEYFSDENANGCSIMWEVCEEM